MKKEKKKLKNSLCNNIKSFKQDYKQDKFFYNSQIIDLIIDFSLSPSWIFLLEN